MAYYCSREKIQNHNRKEVQTLPRKFEVTRTIESTKVTALVFNKETAEAEDVTFTVAGRYQLGDKKLDKIVAKKIVAPELKFIEVVDAVADNKMYGISLNDFMSHATELDPKTRQPFAE